MICRFSSSTGKTALTDTNRCRKRVRQGIASGGNMRHRSRTARTGPNGEMGRHAKFIVTPGKIASFALRDGRKIAKSGGALAGGF